MASITSLKASDGTGNASVATVQSVRSSGATTLVVDTVQGINTKFHATMGTPHTFVDPVTSETIAVISEATAVDFVGHVDGSNLEIDTIAPGFTDAGSAVNDIVIIKPTTQWADEVANVLEVSLENDGTLQTGAVLDALGLNSPLDGWNPGLPAPDTITYNGNRSYDLVFNSTDLTDTLSPGMRLRTTRTVTAPIQCTDLESGSSQFWRDTTVSGMTFTDDFVVGVWVKLESYAIGTVISRFNNTSGWVLKVIADGRFRLIGYNAGASNYSFVQSVQSLPLGKWVHIAAQLDMSAFTATPTTSYVMVDGIDVPAIVTRAGTNPTALVQAGNLEIGADVGTNFFDGKIAQAFVSSAKITQANVRTLISQGLTASLISTHSIVSAYDFNGNANDLNTTNANNLTAQGSASYSADSPFSDGANLASGFTDGATDFGVVMTSSFSTNTTLVVQVPEGCTIPTSGGISAIYYSSLDTPYGFVRDKGRYEVGAYLKARQTAAGGSAFAFQNLNQYLTVPAGLWDLGYSADGIVTHAGANYLGFALTLSTANNTQSDSEFTINSPAINVSLTQIGANGTKRRPVKLTTGTTYYLNIAPSTTSSTLYIGDASAVAAISYITAIPACL